MKKKMIAPIVIGILCATNLVYAAGDASGDYAKRLEALEQEVFSQKQETQQEKANDLQVHGFFRYRYEWSKTLFNPFTGPDGTPTDRTNYHDTWVLNMVKPFDKDLYTSFVLMSGAMGGRTELPNHSPNNDVTLAESLVAGKIDSHTEVAAGRIFVGKVGYGLMTENIPATSGLRLKYNNDKLSFTIYNVRFNDDTLLTGDVKYKADKDLELSLAYFNDLNNKNRFAYYAGYTTDPNGMDAYNSKALGFKYSGIPDIVVTTELGKNDSAVAQGAKGMYAMAKYKGANPFKKGSNGVWVAYKRGEKGFDVNNFTSNGNDTPLDAPWNMVSPAGGKIDNCRGWEIGFETTIAPHVVFTVSYDKMKALKDQQGSIAVGDAGVKMPYGGPVSAGQDISYLMTSVSWMF
ncbi:MAG TPA: hypothetical protein VGL27_16475 [Negativicutes bacterium]